MGAGEIFQGEGSGGEGEGSGGEGEGSGGNGGGKRRLGTALSTPTVVEAGMSSSSPPLLTFVQ